MELKRVVVTGLGAITPIGNTVSEFLSGGRAVQDRLRVLTRKSLRSSLLAR